MPRNGTGIYTLPQPAFTAGTVISSAAVNSDLSDIATALTGSLPRDGQVGMTGQLKMPDGSTVVPSMAFTNATGTGFSRNGTTLSVSIAGVSVGAFTPTGWTGLTTFFPVGSIIDFSGSSTPALWLLCFGQAVSRTTYANLFTAISTTYGAGDGSTTFNLPDLRDYVAVGKGNMGGSDAGRLTTAFFGSDPTVLGNTGGVQSRSLITANLPPYTPAGTANVVSGSNGIMISTSIVNTTTGTAGVNFAGGTFNGTSLSNIGSSGPLTGTAQGGTSTAFAILPPGVILNKIIYAGV